MTQDEHPHIKWRPTFSKVPGEEWQTLLCANYIEGEEHFLKVHIEQSVKTADRYRVCRWAVTMDHDSQEAKHLNCPIQRLSDEREREFDSFQHAYAHAVEVCQTWSA